MASAPAPLKALVILVLTGVIFGSATFFTWNLFFRRNVELTRERALPSPPPLPDPTLGDFNHVMELEQTATVAEARDAWRDFVERYPQSTRIDEAKDRLGMLNSRLLFSPAPAPDKQSYVVLPGEVITKVAAKLKTTPELIMRVNGMNGAMLRRGQKLTIIPTDFSLLIDRRRQKVVLQQGGKFFRQYPILTMPTVKKLPPGQRPPKVTGRVADKKAFRDGAPVIFTDKTYMDADHWVVVSPAGHSLYAEQPVVEGAPPAQKPIGGGYGMAADAMQEIAAVLRKNDPVIIE